jgi:hypothetical protein
MAGRPPPGNPGAKGRAAGSSGSFGQPRQGSGGSFSGNFNAGPSDGGGGNGVGIPQGDAQFGLGAGFGFNARPQGNQNNIQQFQGESGNLGFPQVSQGGQGSFPPQENFNSVGGFAGNAARCGGQGNGNQRNFKNSNFRGGRPTYKARANNSLGGAGVNSKASAGSSGLHHSKANLGESSSTNVSAGNDIQVEGKKKAKKESCYRCGSNGHLFFECTAILCEYYEQVGHNPDDCHLLSAPKPQLILHGISDKKLMFFECSITKSYQPKLESTRLGLLSVTGGELSIPTIIAQLRRLVPVENFSWECRQVGHNVFKITFPDREEIEGLARFGTFHVLNSSIQLNFEQCVSSMEPTSKLPEIWILMSGIRQRRIGDFLAMWSLGTLFGKTLKVNMKYTREKGVLRILVGCLDFRRIPAKERIFIADGFYDISFEVQVQSDLEMTSAANPGEDPSDGDGHGNNGDNTSESQKNQDAMDTDATLNLQDQEGSKNSATNGPNVNRLAGEFSSRVKFSPRVKHMMEQSRLELSAFIKSLSPSAAVAENTQEVDAVPSPTTVDAQAGPCATSGFGAGCPAAATSAAGDVATPASSAGAGDSPAALPRTSSPASASLVAPSVDSPAATTQGPAPSSIPAVAVSSAAVRDSQATPTKNSKNSFRTSAECAVEIFQGSGTPSSPILAVEGAAQLSPSKGAVGSGSLEISENAPSGCEKQAPLGKGTPRIATNTFSPSTPASKSKKIEDVIAFGGISEKIASPIRSSQRVRM